MIYEQRIYSAVPGKLPALLRRFEDHTMGLWERHGIRQAGVWTTLIGPSHLDLTYMIAWDSLEERERKWTAFQTDPDWIKARADSEKDGQILANVASQLLVPTAFSSVR